MTKLGVFMSALQGFDWRSIGDPTVRFWQQRLVGAWKGALSARLALRCVQRRAPFLQQRLPTTRIADIRGVEPRHPVGAKMSEILPRLAPGHHHPHLVEKAEREWPDQAPGGGAAGVAVKKAEF